MPQFGSYPLAATIDGTELIVVLQGGVTKRVTIANIGVGVGSSGNPIYTGSAPPTAPGDPTKTAIFYPDQATGGNMKNWDVANQVWF